MKTDYVAHEEIYRARKAMGLPGWQDADTLEETLAELGGRLKSKYAPSGGRVLELGCGAGDLALCLAGKGYEVHGVDIAPTAILWAQEKARERKVRAEFRVGSVLDLAAYPDDTFDLVLDGYCLHCIIGEDRRRFLAGALRVLKPGASLHIATMCGEVTSPGIRKSFDAQSRCVLREDGVATRYIGLPKDILIEIGSVGLGVLDWRIKPRTEKEGDMDELLVWATKE